jgi:PAS domain S-box-containing protein
MGTKRRPELNNEINPQANQSFRKSELNFRKLIEYSYAGTALLNKDNYIVYQSFSAEQITGRNLSLLKERSIYSLVYPEDLPQLRRSINQITAKPGSKIAVKFRILHHLGYYIWLDAMLTNLLEDPHIQALSFSFIDITGQMELETKRLQTEKQRDFYSEISSFFRGNHTMEYMLERVLASVLRFTGGKEAAIWLLNATCLEFVKFAATPDISLAVSGGLAERVWREKSILTGDLGEIGLPLYQHEEFVGVLTLDIDTEKIPVTGNEQFWEALSHQLGMELHHRQMSEQLEVLFDRAPDLIGIMGADRVFKKVNPAMCNQLEYTEQEILALSLDKLVCPDDLAVSKERTNAFLAGGDQTMYFENRFKSKSGKIIWLSWTVTRSAGENVMFCVGKNISDKKEVEDLLDKASQLARIGGWEVDRVKGTAYWSPITRDIYEVPKNFIPRADNWLSFYQEGADRDYIAGKMADVIATGKPCDVELKMLTARGNIRWIRAIAEAEFKEGRCIRVFGSFQDIDSRKKAELEAIAALKERNEILDSIGDGFFAVDNQWKVTYWNAAAERSVGRSRDEMLGRCFWDVYPDVTELEFYRQYQRAKQTGKAVHFEDFYPHLEAWFSVSAYPSESGLSVFFKNINESKAATQALAESEKRYSDLFHLSPLPMFVYEMSTLRYLDVNLAAIRHYGYSREEFLSMTIFDIRPAEDLPLVKKIVTDHENQDKFRLDGVFRHLKKNGEIIRVDVQSNKIIYHGVQCKVVLANDVTERVRYTEAIESQNKKLMEISWMQSHVIRAPLSRIMGLLPMLDKPIKPEQQQIHEYLVKSANELDSVIRSITNVTSMVHLK